MGCTVPKGKSHNNKNLSESTNDTNVSDGINDQIQFSQYQKDQLDRFKILTKNIVSNNVTQKNLNGKDLALILGITGVGKSTFLNNLKGLKFEPSKDGKIKLQQPEKCIAEIGEGYNSTTLNINYIQKSELFICDPPGFLDSKGFEGDLINSITTINAINNAKSIRFLLMFVPELNSMNGRGSQFKELCIQYTKILLEYSEYLDSIILVFNCIKKEEEENIIRQLIENYKSIQKSMISKEEIDFVSMLIKKLMNQNYIIFDPLKEEDYKVHLNKIKKLTPLNKDKIDSNIKFSLPQKSENDFQIFLSQIKDMLKFCVKNSYHEQALEIVTSFSQLCEHVNSKIVKELYRKALEDIQEQESIIHQFQNSFNSFATQEIYTEDTSQNVIKMMRQVLKFSYIIEFIQKVTKNELKMKNTINSIIQYIQNKFDEIFQLSQKNLQFEIKYYHVQKLKSILENENLQYDFKYICNQLYQQNNCFLQNIFNNKNYDFALFDLQQCCQKLSHEISNIIDNQIITNEVKIILKNVKFINDNNKIEIIQLDNNLNYQEIQQKIINQINTLINKINQIKGKESQQKNNIRKELEKSYQFIKFICSVQNTENHFQGNNIQNVFSNLKDTIKKYLIELYKQGINMKLFYDISQIKYQILVFQRLDKDITQDLSLDSNYNSFEMNLNNLYQNQKNQLQQNFQNICKQIKDFKENENQQILSDNLFNEIKKIVIDLEKMKEIISELLMNQQQNYNEFEKEKMDYFSHIEQAISGQINDDDKLRQNFKNIHILIAIQTGYSEYNNTSCHISILQNQNRQIQFLQQLKDWIKNIIELQVFANTKNFNLDELGEINKRMQKTKTYLSFLQDFKNIFVKPISKIYSKVIQINTKIQEEFLSEDDKLFPQQNSFDISIIQDIDKEIQNINRYLHEFKQLLNKLFQETYNIDFDQLDDLEKKDFSAIKEILKKLKTLWSDKYIHEIYPKNENKYVQVQEKVISIMKKELKNINSLDVNQIEERKIKLQEFEVKNTIIAGYIPLDIKLQLEKERLKIETDQKRLDQQLKYLLNEDKYKEISELYKTLDQIQQQNFKMVFNFRIISIKNAIKDTVEVFNQQPSHELQKKIFQYYSNFKDAQKNFSVLIQEYNQTEVQQSMKLFIIKLLEKIFNNLQQSNNRQAQRQENNESEQHREIMNITSIIFKKLKELQGDQLYNLGTFQINIKEKIKQAQASLQNPQIDFNMIQQNINTLTKINQIINELELSILYEYLNEIQNERGQLYKAFNSAIQNQTQTFIHNNYYFCIDEIEQYMTNGFQKIWDFFKINSKKVEKIISDFIKGQLKTFNNLKSKIHSNQIFRIKHAIEQNYNSTLINNEVKNLIEKMSNSILCEYIPQKNFKKVKKSLATLRVLLSFYEKQDLLNIKKSIVTIFQNVSKQILSLWNQLLSQNLKQPYKIQSTLYLIDKLLFIIRECKIEFIEDVCNELNLINILKNSFLNKIEEIKSCIQQMDHDQFMMHFQELTAAFKEYIPFYGKKRNYLMVFNKIIKVYTKTEQLKDKNKICDLISQFEQLNNLFIKLIQDFQQESIKQLKLQFEQKQFQQMLDSQLKFQIFCEKIKEEGIFFQNNQFIYNQILTEYEICFKKAKNMGRSNQNELKQLGTISKSLQEMEEWFQEYIKPMKTKMYSHQIKKIIENEIKTMINNTGRLIENFDQEQNIKEFVKKIIEIFVGTVELGVSELHINIKNIIQKATENQEMDVVLDLQYHLNQDPVGYRIQDEYQDIFKQFFIQYYNSKTKDQNSFDYIKDKLEIQQADGDIKFSVDELFKQYQSYRSVYDETNQLITQFKNDKTSLTKSILQKAEKFKKNNKYLTDPQIVWNKEQKKQLIEILGEVSAIWSIIDRQEQDLKTTRFIHTIQIIIIMRMLNIDMEQPSQVFNHIAQVRTGEGKSITLGITSTIFALIGFQVDCCCYSQYLSDRDYNDFETFFINFSVEKQIQYNTFYKLTEKIINHPNDLRTLGENYFTSNQQQIQKQEQNKVKKILMIDEIDFFFGENFFGEVYAVGCQFTNQQVVNLMKMIWNKRFRNFSIDTIKSSIEYKDLFQKNIKLNSMKEFIDKKIEKMIKDSKEMEKHAYLLDKIPNSVERRIGYKEIDRISYDTVKGYKTAYAHMQEWQRKKITSEQLYKQLAFNFNLGCFSYPKIIECYSLVLGVTGTLKCMTDFQKLKMKDLCKIQKSTITPSLYGDSKFIFDKTKDVQMFNSRDEYFKEILQQIKQEINKNRSIIIFFENQKILFEYKNYSEENGVSDLQLLFEQTVDKKAVIAKAAYSKVITLSTKPFGRGTDFKCYDKNLLKSGGIHAIQTFLSDTLAEEIQIQGRVARNGEPGSYSIILFQQDLESQFQTDFKSIPEKAQLYDFLSNKRKNLMKIQDQKLNLKQKEAEVYHKKSIQLIDLLNQTYQQINKINQLLDEISVYGDTKDNKISKPSQYYNNINQQDLQNVKKDKYKNAIDFGLGKKGQFKDLSILIGQFCEAPDCDITRDIQKELKSSLSKYGFKNFEIATEEKSFVQQIHQFDQVWVISGKKFICQENNIEKDFVNSITKHLKQRRGLLLFADNQPYFYHANLILKNIPIGYDEQNPVYMELKGEHKANNKLKRGRYNNKLEFGDHPLTYGLNEIYEGNTICYPKILNGKPQDTYDDFLDIEIIGTSETNMPCMFVLNGNNKRGRIVFDCGFTKITSNNWNNTAGTSNYIQNCYAWLYFMDKDEQ